MFLIRQSLPQAVIGLLFVNHNTTDRMNTTLSRSSPVAVYINGNDPQPDRARALQIARVCRFGLLGPVIDGHGSFDRYTVVEEDRSGG